MEPLDKFAPANAEHGLNKIQEKHPKNLSVAETNDDDVPFSSQRRSFGVQGNKGQSSC